MKDKYFKWIIIILTIMIGWDKLVKFIESFFEGLNEVLNSLPPLLLVGLVIVLIWLNNPKK